MRKALIACLIVAAGLSVGIVRPAQTQDKDQTLTCTAAALRAVQPLPKLRYKCRPDVNEYDDAILKWPERLSALNAVIAQLKNLTQPSWWQADVVDLNACTLKKRVGKLTKEEQQRFRDDYFLNLLGNDDAKLVIVEDPCYQHGYSGSVLFLLSRNGPSTFVTTAYDGYFSRIDNSVGFDWANLPGEQILEVSTGNNMPPAQENFYFLLDLKSHRIQPKKLFKNGNEFTNKIDSEMMMSSDEDLPEDAGQIMVIKDHKLAPTFNTYMEDDEGKIEADGKKFMKTTFRWNGHFYEKVQ
ncbi:MAG: hypothetical protein C5B55_07050 [Blastocatellia bacterium]|nr:MAG: hypothetical protein C5B55_07050 [Blastocatellia bacterium]